MLSNNIDISDINLGDLLYSDESVCQSTIKEIFPDWDGDNDSEQGLETNYVEISLNDMLYST